MKLIHKLFLVALMFSVSACQMFDLDLLDNPNEATQADASIDDLYNNVQINFKNFLSDMWYSTASLPRMISNTSSYQYATAFSPESFNTIWYRAYASLLPDIDATIEASAARSLGFYSGTAKVMKSYVLSSLVDLFGDVPYSEYGQGTDIIAPANDQGSSLYATADGLLDEAIAEITAYTSSQKPNDNFYGGSNAKWITAAKSL